MVARILRQHATDDQRRAVVPLRKGEAPAIIELGPLAGAAGAIAGSEHERVLALTMHEFEHRWQEREQVHSAALRAADARAEAKLRSEVTEAVQAFTRAADALVAERTALLHASEEAALRVCLAVARKVIEDALRADERFVLQVVRRALRFAADARHVVLHVHPDDLELVRSHAPEWVAATHAGGGPTIAADPGVRRGGCRVVTDACEIAATIDQQLAAIETALISATEATP